MHGGWLGWGVHFLGRGGGGVGEGYKKCTHCDDVNNFEWSVTK